MKIRKSLVIPAILGTMLLTGCGSYEKNFAAADNYVTANKAPSASYDSVASVEVNMDYGDEDYSDNVGGDYLDKKNNTSSDVIRKEMLVYTCDMTVDVLEFDKAINAFRKSLDAYGAFIEKEQYSDGGGGGRWQYADAEKWQTYTATVRVPSDSYDEFCSSASDLGDLRSKHSGVQNLSAEYYDLSTTLEIYEAKEARYLELLSTIKDEQYAIAVEKELTDIQIEISKIKTRMKDIKTDVAYSYVYITINEVREYQAEPVKTDTFLQRLTNTLSRSGSGFLSFLEGTLMFLIYVIPYVLVFGAVIFGIVKLCKASAKRRAAKKAKKAAAQKPAVQEAPKADEEDKK